MSIAVEPLTHRDLAAATASLAAAFATYPLFPPLCPNAKRRPRVIEAFCRYLARMSLRCDGIFGTADRSAVVCVWPPGWEWPSRLASLRHGAFVLLWHIGFRGTHFLTRLERGFDIARRKHVPGPHWYLPLLGVRPDSQGKGFSRAVLEPVFAAADRDRLPIYLETMLEVNVAIYRRLGFDLVGQSELAGGLPNWELRRDPG